MQNYKRQVTIRLCFALAGYIIGFFICTTAVDNVFIGISVMALGMAFTIASLIPVIKMAQRDQREKEDRIARLETEIEKLKKKLEV